MFFDDLLTTYQTLKSRFYEILYLLYKSFEFRSLWDVSSILARYERTAVQAVARDGTLNEVAHLNMAIGGLTSIGYKAAQCFSKFRHSIGIFKWSLNNVKDAEVCMPT